MRLRTQQWIRGVKMVASLSLHDYFHERLISICAVLGLAAVLAPLLVLFGVKNGIINTMADRLIEDPRNREVTPVGSGRYTGEWLAAATKLPQVSFIIPQTRSIAASMVLVNRKGTTPYTLGVDLIPTGEGDPLLLKWGLIPSKNSAVVLSESAARKLHLAAGETVMGRVGRSRGGVREQVTIELTVAAVLPIEAFSRDGAFVRLPLLEATEDYRDGYGVAAFGWPGASRPGTDREYPSFRLYTRSIYDVAMVRNMLTDDGIEVYTKAEEIEVVRRLDRSFTLIFRLISAVAVLGYFASMASNVLAMVNRKSRHLGITRLIGFSTRSIVFFPMVQSMATGILGSLTAVVLYLIAQGTINRLFGQYLGPGEYVCKLSMMQMAFALALTVGMSVLASAYAAFRVARIEPSEVIRDV